MIQYAIYYIYQLKPSPKRNEWVDKNGYEHDALYMNDNMLYQDINSVHSECNRYNANLRGHEVREII